MKQACFVFLFLISSFLRFFRIDQLTEFLGDQGRTGIVIYDALINKSLPLVGPPVLTGQHLGPFFYYLVGLPFIVSGFNPLWPSLFMAVLGVGTVLILFYVSEKIFGLLIGFSISLLFAISPLIVKESRILWDPTPIPFFILLFILSIYKIYGERNFCWFLLLGFTLGVLAQLHYPNMFFLILTACFSFYLFLTRKKKETAKRMLSWMLLSVVSFCLTLFPFLIYQINNAFIDIKGVLISFLLSESITVSTMPIYSRALDLSARLFHHVIPLNNTLYMGIFILLGLLLPLLKRNFWNVFFVSWFVAGISIISLFKGIVFDHYLSFLLPVPFFLLGASMKTALRFVPGKVLFVFIIIIAIIQLSKTDIFSSGTNDIKRTGIIANEVLIQAGNTPFSFTLISSRSFSDVHYRYFFRIKGKEPEPITDGDYVLLFLICEKLPHPEKKGEKLPCPEDEEIKKLPEVAPLCFESPCKLNYSKISLKEFRFISSKELFDGKLFTFERN